MKRPSVLALLCACTWLGAAAYPQFQCDNGNQLLVAPAPSTKLANQRGGTYGYDCYVRPNCDINTCNWLSGWILKSTDDVSQADCADCGPFGNDLCMSINDQKIRLYGSWQDNRNDLWICPRHCQAMPQINVQVTVQTSKVTWSERNAAWGSFREQDYPWHWKSPIAPGTFRVADRSGVTTTSDTFTVLLPGATCESGGRNCHTFIKREGWEDDVADQNVYSLRSKESCLQKRYESNWNARILSCRQWKPPGDFPTMVHFSDDFWSAEPKNIHNFDAEQKGEATNQQSILQCGGLARTGLSFQTAPCWRDTTVDKLLFSIKPFYTAYRNHNSKADKTSCRMLVHGTVNANSEKWNYDDLQTRNERTESDVRKPTNYWESPPYAPVHVYGLKSRQNYMDLVKTVRPDVVTNNRGEIKTISYNLGCMRGDSPGASGDALYYQSECKAIQCIDFMTKPCYDNVYRYDEMVCTLIEKVFKTTITFQKFMQDIVPQTKYQDPFMSYGRYPPTGPSYFQISFDNAKVDVTRDGNTQVQPEQPTAFTLTSTILVALKPMLSCDGCTTMHLHGRASPPEAVLLNHIIACRACLLYERVKKGSNYHDCFLCERHQVRHPDPQKTDECRKCKEIDPLTPMRRAAPHPQTDANCTTCQHFQYFNGESDAGCEFLQTVADGIVVTNTKAALSGKDYYIQDEIRKEIDARFYRDTITADTPWLRELVPQPCIPSPYEPATLVKRLKFTAWCGHHEMLRHHQAWLQRSDTRQYVPLNRDEARTRINTSAVELCGSNALTLTRVRGSTTADLACGLLNFSFVRGGFSDPCALCLGAKYTQNCWPTYVPGLEVYDDAYFLPANKALAPQPGTCANCNARCDNNLQANSYIDPVEYSCWWNGTGRVPGLLGSAASTSTTFSWYKPAPCTKCTSVKLTAGAAKLVLACGNRVSYRRWLDDAVTGSELDATRSIPSIQICCVEKLDDPLATIATDAPAKFETFSQLNCKQTVDDTPPALLPYCPRLWYVDEACALASALWNPDCCVKCKPCRGGLFKLDAYYDCPGDEFFDSQDRGCTTKCLTNQYLRNDQCIKCEACE